MAHLQQALRVATPASIEPLPEWPSAPSAPASPRPWPTWVWFGSSALMCLAAVLASQRWVVARSLGDLGLSFALPASEGPSALGHPLVELLKLASAAAMGTLVTLVHQRYPGDKPHTRSLLQAQILLAVAGALMMIVIGNSVARALGIAGGASIIRFRTPVDDAKDTTVLFLLLGLGMACGLGAVGVAALGTGFLCVFLAALDRLGERRRRTLLLELVARGPEVPTEHVDSTLRRFGVEQYELRSLTHGQNASLKYHVTLDPNVSIAQLSSQLLGASRGDITSLAWANPKKEC